MKTINKMVYVSPAIRVADVELAGFVCASIQQMSFVLEVDEYGNMGEEIVEFNDWM